MQWPRHLCSNMSGRIVIKGKFLNSYEIWLYSASLNVIITGKYIQHLWIFLCLSMLQILRLGRVQIVYVESICRVDTLSMSAWMLYYVADQMLVQWPSLQTKFPRTQYIGKLVWPSVSWLPCVFHESAISNCFQQRYWSRRDTIL